MCLFDFLSTVSFREPLSPMALCKVESPYPGGQLHTVVEIPKPEEMGEAVSDVKWA